LSDALRSYLDFHLDVSRRMEHFRNGMLFSAELEITNACNLSCKYCYASANIKKTGLGAETVIDILHAMKRTGLAEVGWIGGEPLLVKELHDWMGLAKDLGLTNVLYTNGLLIDRAQAKILAGQCSSGRIVMHLDSINYDHWAAGQMRPTTANFEKNKNALLELVDAGYPADRIVMSIPLSRACYEVIDETMEYFISNGVRFINLIPLTPLGLSSDKKAFITPEELWDAMVRRAQALDMPELIHLGICEYCKQFQMTDISVNCEGSVLPYVDYFSPVGSVYNDGFEDIVLRNFRELSLSEWVTPDTMGNRIKGYCGICEHSTWCFGNPVSREPVILGEPDRDCILVRRHEAKQK